MIVGRIVSESAFNEDGEGRGVTAFSEEPDLGGGVGECRVNNEPVEISW